MPRCIYCQEDKSPESYKKSEHVLSQSFGRFENNFTLIDIVCDPCNEYFGKSLELYLGRDSYEGQMRFRHGVKPVEEFKGVGRDSRLVVRCAEGQFAGCLMRRYYSEEKGSIAVRPLPQVGFWLEPPGAYRYYLLDQIPTQSELVQLGFQTKSPRAIVGLEVDPPELQQLLAAKGIAFNHGGALEPDVKTETIGCDLEGTIDHTIFRAIAKIAFNYLAYWEGAEFVQNPEFDTVRRYIRWGDLPGYKLIHADDASVLEGEPDEGLRVLGHFVTVNWAADGVSVLAQVSLFNWMTYHVCLAPDFTGPPPELTRGHLFNVSNLKILELGSRPRSPS
jgi:hypothetical protein